jgi:His-Xaa-Ser system radical SAM maturase HxsC
MITLRGRSTNVTLRAPLRRHLWVLTNGAGNDTERARCAFLVETETVPPSGYGLYIAKPGAGASRVDNLVVLPSDLAYLEAGDVVGLSADGVRIDVLWRCASRQNSILLTEQCDNYCLMCSQPPKPDDDTWLLDRAAALIGLLPPDTRELTFTGGEPTLSGARFLNLLRLASDRLPQAEIHILSNGRRFADDEFAVSYAAIDNPRVMVGIPLYGAESALHDYVVQAHGAFDETVRGILNLARLDQRIEIRVVLHRQTAPVIAEIAEFIARNVPFVEQVALMGLEIMGLARGNLQEVWIDPHDYRTQLTEAALLLDAAGIRTMIYNHQLCLLDRRAWPFAVQSISDWKNEYDATCQACHMRQLCGGFFHSAKYKSSSHIHPIDATGAALPRRELLPAIGRWQRRA